MPNVKGVAFRTVMAVTEKERGKEFADAAFEKMAKDVREAFQYGTIITAGFYPVSWYRAMWRGILDVSKEGEDELVRFLGRACVDHDFNGLYKTLFRMLKPSTLVSIGMRHFSNVYDTGKVEVLDVQAKGMRVRWTGCEDFDKAMWLEIIGSCERLAELAGGKTARGTVQEGGGDGHEHCLASFHWA